MIKQLITDLAYDRITLTQALSRAKILAYKIKNQEFQLWLKRELEGYDINNYFLPSYRKIPCTIKATVSDYWGYNEQTTTLAFTAASDDLKEIMNFVLETKSISAIEESYKIIDTETAIQYFKPEQLKSMEETFKFKEKFDRLIIRAGREFNKQYLKIIIDHTKQKLLD